MPGKSSPPSPALFNAGEIDLRLLKVSKSGDLIWQTTYGGAGIDLGFDIIEAPDGSRYTAG